MGWLKKMLQKTTIGGSLDITGKILGISNDSVFNPKASAAETQTAKSAADARAAAEKQAADTQAAAERSKLELANLESNSLALSNANADTTAGSVANVVAGGFADAVDPTKKRRLQTQTLASTLGLNI